MNEWVVSNVGQGMNQNETNKAIGTKTKVYTNYFVSVEYKKVKLIQNVTFQVSNEKYSSENYCPVQQSVGFWELQTEL